MSAARDYEKTTVLELGAHGRYRSATFTLVGRTCLRSGAGGLWNEWTARFEDGRVVTIAEARGFFTVFAERALAPSWDDALPGQSVDTGFVVVERGKATRAATWGDVEDAPRTYRYADLSSRAGVNATLDYGEREPRTFVGERVTLAELGLLPRRDRPRFLAAPSAPRPKGLEPCLAIGDEATVVGLRVRVIGLVHRSIRIEGERYTWEEYLLHDVAKGFRWLAVSDGHWNLVESIEPGMVTASAEKATYDGETYRAYSGGTARLEWADGELPWEASIGDETRVRDYVHAPHMLSFESTTDEISWSRGVYVPTETIARAFGKRILPKPVGRAPNQPRKIQPSRR